MNMESNERRRRTLTDADLDALTERLASSYQEQIEQHSDDHMWVRAQRDAANARARFWNKMFEHAVKWGILSGLSAAAYALWLGIKEQLHQ